MANCHQAVLWVENVLKESEEFALCDLKTRFSDEQDDEEAIEGESEIILVDVTEQPIERPKYEQEKSYSGKKNGTRRNTRYYNYQLSKKAKAA